MRMKYILYPLLGIFLGFATSHYQHSSATADKEGGYQVLISDGTHFILCISGIATEPNQFERPLKPEDCQIRLRTQDGRDWRATWTPAK